MEIGAQAGHFEVGIAVAAIDDTAGGRDSLDGQGGDVLPGYDETSGSRLRERHAGDRPLAVVVKGEAAVSAATDAIAGQIGLAAERIVAAIEAQDLASPAPGKLGLESVEVSFGITLAAGVQALFTTQAESSAQVCIRLVRQPDTDG